MLNGQNEPNTGIDFLLTHLIALSTSFFADFGNRVGLFEYTGIGSDLWFKTTS